MEAEATTSNATAGVQQLDLVFTMDCTGSMEYIAAAKQNIETIVNKLAAQKIDLRFGLVATVTILLRTRRSRPGPSPSRRRWRR